MSIEAMRKALNYIENTEGELGIKLSCGDALREALAAQPPAAPVEDALGYAQRLATILWEKHYKTDAPEWKPLPDVVGVLTQIDNMTSGLQRSSAGTSEVQRETFVDRVKKDFPEMVEDLGRPKLPLELWITWFNAWRYGEGQFTGSLVTAEVEPLYASSPLPRPHGK